MKATHWLVLVVLSVVAMSIFGCYHMPKTTPRQLAQWDSLTTRGLGASLYYRQGVVVDDNIDIADLYYHVSLKVYKGFGLAAYVNSNHPGYDNSSFVACGIGLSWGKMIGKKVLIDFKAGCGAIDWRVNSYPNGGDYLKTRFHRIGGFGGFTIQPGYGVRVDILGVIVNNSDQYVSDRQIIDSPYYGPAFTTYRASTGWGGGVHLDVTKRLWNFLTVGANADATPGFGVYGNSKIAGEFNNLLPGKVGLLVDLRWPILDEYIGIGAFLNPTYSWWTEEVNWQFGISLSATSNPPR